MLTINDLCFSFPKNSQQFYFKTQFNSGKLSLITGASGSGKSTLLGLIAGFYNPKSGMIFHNQKNITMLKPAERNLAFLFQEYNLFPHLTVYQNIAIGIKNNGKLSNPENQIIAEILAELQLTNLTSNLPQNLSGGEKQRTALARILAQIRTHQCKILLLDEPFSALDEKLRQKLITITAKITTQFNLITLLVSHDHKELTQMVDHWLIVDSGEIISTNHFEKIK